MNITDLDIFLDAETYSDLDIKAVGGRRYAESPNFEILLLSYSVGLNRTSCIDLYNGFAFPLWLIHEMLNPNTIYTFHAWNAAFERYILTIYFRRIGLLGENQFLDPSKWRCTMVLAASCGLPLKLALAGKALHISAQKLEVGKALIDIYCKPQKPTKKQPNTRIYPNDIKGAISFAKDGIDPYTYSWDMFKYYNIVDVEAEKEIYQALPNYDYLNSEYNLYTLDQIINDRGIEIDLEFAENAYQMNLTYKAKIKRHLEAVTGVNNINSGDQLKKWLSDRSGILDWDITKDSVKNYLDAKTFVKSPAWQFVQNDDLTRRVLKGRLILSKNSPAKYKAMKVCTSADRRARGLFQMNGANRTGRYAGRRIQLQNLPQNHIKELELARRLVSNNNYEGLEFIFGNVVDTVSQLIRTALVAPKNKTFVVADFSAIEARIIAWLSGELWRSEVFKNGGDIYSASASKMFHVDLEKCGKGTDYRAKGKVAELALGYGGGVNALLNMGGDKLGLSDSEMKMIVKKWRESSPNIVRLWRMLEDAAVECVAYGVRKTACRGLIEFDIVYNNKGQKWLAIRLPSGRKLLYLDPKLQPAKYGDGLAVTYLGTDDKGLTITESTYGGKLAENVTQAIARDLLTFAMQNVEKNHPIVAHVHDEIIAEADEQNAEASLKAMEVLMSLAPLWADGLILNADGYTTKFYKKAD